MPKRENVYFRAGQHILYSQLWITHVRTVLNSRGLPMQAV